jgi:hypothetical protein
MSIQYVTDAEGHRVAVVVPIEQWEAMQAKLDGLALDEIEASDKAWQDYLGGKTKPLAQVIQEQLHDRAD